MQTNTNIYTYTFQQPIKIELDKVIVIVTNTSEITEE